MLSQVSSLFFLEFAAGTLLFMLFMPLKELKNTFFLLNGGISLLFLFLFSWLTGSFRHLIFPAIVLLLISYFLFLVRVYLISRILLCASVVLSLTAVFARGMTGIEGTLTSAAQIFGGLSLLLGALLLGVCYGTMILGHWYLVTPELPFKFLISASRFFIGTAVARAVFIILAFAGFFYLLGSQGKMLVENLVSFDGLGVFFIMRVFWGILGPLVLSYMILETAKIRHNQAATGILYVACIFVFIGELCAGYIFQMGGIPT